MIIMVLAISGITLIYAGVLTMPESSYAGIVMSLLGVFLAIKPAVHLSQYLRSLSSAGPRSSEKRGKGGRKSHLKVVKSDKEKPTYH